MSDLTNSSFFILLAVADGPMHGLGIVADTEKRTGGRVKMGPALLYSSIKRLLRDGLICEASTIPKDADPRRKYYEITPVGREAVRDHAELWAATVEVAREKKVIR